MTTHRYAYAYGDSQHDPWPGDLARIDGTLYRFQQTFWMLVPRDVR